MKTIKPHALLTLAALLLAGSVASPLIAVERPDPASILPVIDRIPAQSWINVKTDVEPRAVGDGVADDTKALQAGLDRLSGGADDREAAVLYLPPGTYRITDRLVMSRVHRRPGNRMVGHGAATRIVWDGVTENITHNASSLATLRSNPNFPDSPDEREERSPEFIEITTYRGSNYGQRMAGWLLAPQTGNYVFHLSGDNECEFRLSGSTLPLEAVTLSRVPGWTELRQWDKYPEQKSEPVTLQRGQLYFFEVFHKQGSEGSHVSLGWTLPDNTREMPIPISRSRIAPQASAGHALRFEFWKDQPERYSHMFVSGGASESSYSGIVFDGNGKARIGLLEQGEFKTMMTYEYCAFINCTVAGVKMGPQNPNATAETEFVHSVFANNGIGLAIDDFNYYNIVVDGCLFRDNGTGVRTSRYGQVYARNSRFEYSKDRDFHLGASHKHAIRRCVSVGSRLFIEGTHFTVQDCFVSEWTHPEGAIIIGAGSPPILIFDTTFESAPSREAPIFDKGNALVILSNINSHETNDLFDGNNRLMIPPGKYDGEVYMNGLELDFSPPPAPTKLFDAMVDFHGNVQATINAARAHGKGAIAYFPAGRYNLSSTIDVSGEDYTIMGDGYNTQFMWRGDEGETVFKITDPQNLRLDNFMVVTFSGVPRDMLCIKQVSTGKPSSITYNRVMAGLHGEFYRTDDSKNVRGIEFLALGEGSRVHMNMVSGSVAFINCSAADILMRFQYGGPIVVENDAGTPRTGFLGGLNVNHINELVVRDSSDIVFTEFYMEQGKHGLIQLHGKPGDPMGQVTLGASRLHQWADSPYFAYIDGYHGQLTYAHADVTFDNSPPAYLIKQPSPSPFTLALFGHNRFGFDLKLDPTAKSVLVANRGKDNLLAGGGLEAISAALDHWRLLGRKDGEFRRNHNPANKP